MTILALPEASLHYVEMKQPKKKSSVPGCSNWTSLELRLPKCRDYPRRVVLVANCPEECQTPKTSQRDMPEKSHCRSRHNQQECRPGGKVCLPQTPTRSSAIAEGPRDASCQLKSCQLPRNSAETTYTTSPDQRLVAWLSGRTSVSGRRTFPVLRSTSSTIHVK